MCQHHQYCGLTESQLLIDHAPYSPVSTVAVCSEVTEIIVMFILNLPVLVSGVAGPQACATMPDSKPSFRTKNHDSKNDRS